MFLRKALIAAPLAFTMACGGTSNPAQNSAAAFSAASPSYAALSMDQVSTDTTPSSLTVSSSPSALVQVIQGVECHPHLFIRQREVVERLNRHIYKALQHVEAVIARGRVNSTTTSYSWESVENGIDRKFTITLVQPNVYGWELDVGPVGTTPLPVVMTGQIDRTGATRPNQGKGSLQIDFGKLYAAYPAEKVTTGTLDVQFDLEASSRKLTVTATGVAWDLDASMFESAYVVQALSKPRSGSYVYYREPGKGGSLKIQDQMVFACPANPTFLPADAQLVSRWYRASDSTLHGRSDAYMTGGQLVSPVDHVAAVTCHEASAEGGVQAESFWLMKSEDASGNTLAGESSEHLGGTASTACDSAFGVVPELQDDTNDFTSWPSSYSDGTPFPFPNM